MAGGRSAAAELWNVGGAEIFQFCNSEFQQNYRRASFISGTGVALGISFYTFQSMGYLLDVYWEKTPAQKNPAKFALFASFFPQIIQGPIAIYDELAAQLNEGTG